jgi:hypothetical protein
LRSCLQQEVYQSRSRSCPAGDATKREQPRPQDVAANRCDGQQHVDRLPDRAKPHDNGHPHRGKTPQQAPPGETAQGKNDTADQNDDGQSTTDVGHGMQHCAIVVLV